MKDSRFVSGERMLSAMKYKALPGSNTVCVLPTVFVLVLEKLKCAMRSHERGFCCENCWIGIKGEVEGGVYFGGWRESMPDHRLTFPELEHLLPLSWGRKRGPEDVFIDVLGVSSEILDVVGSAGASGAAGAAGANPGLLSIGGAASASIGSAKRGRKNMLTCIKPCNRLGQCGGKYLNFEYRVNFAKSITKVIQ